VHPFLFTIVCSAVTEERLVVFMQTPPVYRPSSKGKIGYIVALAGGVITAISFLAIPFISVMGIISLSMLQILNYANTYGSALGSLSSSSSSTTTASQISAAVIFIWLSLVIAIISCIVALIFTVRKGSRAVAGAVSLLVLGVIGTGIFIFIIAQIGAGYVAIGGWLCVLGMLAVAIGGLVALLNRPAAVAPQGYGYNGVPQQPQYQGNPYQQYPQPPPSYPQQSPSYPNYPPQQSQQYPQQPSSPNYPQQPQQYPPQQPPQW
jgi:hypothetical protein